jgi:hypothetical protein
MVVAYRADLLEGGLGHHGIISKEVKKVVGFDFHFSENPAKASSFCHPNAPEVVEIC